MDFCEFYGIVVVLTPNNNIVYLIQHYVIELLQK